MRKKFPVKLLTDAAAPLETSLEVAQGLSLTLGHSLYFSLRSTTMPTVFKCKLKNYYR